jgi:hypothetical protein
LQETNQYGVHATNAVVMQCSSIWMMFQHPQEKGEEESSRWGKIQKTFSPILVEKHTHVCLEVKTGAG